MNEKSRQRVGSSFLVVHVYQFNQLNNLVFWLKLIFRFSSTMRIWKLFTSLFRRTFCQQNTEEMEALFQNLLVNSFISPLYTFIKKIMLYGLLFNCRVWCLHFHSIFHIRCYLRLKVIISVTIGSYVIYYSAMIVTIYQRFFKLRNVWMDFQQNFRWQSDGWDHWVLHVAIVVLFLPMYITHLFVSPQSKAKRSWQAAATGSGKMASSRLTRARDPENPRPPRPCSVLRDPSANSVWIKAQLNNFFHLNPQITHCMIRILQVIYITQITHCMIRI